MQKELIPVNLQVYTEMRDYASKNSGFFYTKSGRS